MGGGGGPRGHTFEGQDIYHQKNIGKIARKDILNTVARYGYLIQNSTMFKLNINCTHQQRSLLDIQSIQINIALNLYTYLFLNQNRDFE